MKHTNRPTHTNRITRRLIDWFAVQARDLPWRRTLDPYAIWVSEIMLQQTQVTTVVPYFERWMNTAPNVQSLAKLSPTQLHKLWEGLGYYTRARNLQKAALQIILEHGREFPEDMELMLALSGIGRYTAGAICSIAFNQPKPIVDGNVIRVLARLQGIEGNPKDKQVMEKFWEASRDLVESAGRVRSKTQPANQHLKFAGNCSMLNQSLMELGATICSPRDPACDRCPVQTGCFARKHQRIDEFPQSPPRTRPTRKRFIAFIIKNQNRFYVRQRPSDVVNANLWELPNVEVKPDEANAVERALDQLHLDADSIDHVETVKHSITRYRVQTECYRVKRHKQTPTTTGLLRTKAQIRKLPFTSAHRRLIKHL